VGAAEHFKLDVKTPIHLNPQVWTVEGARHALQTDSFSSCSLLEECLRRAQSPAGEGQRVFTRLFAEQARAEAGAVDLRRRAGISTGQLGGIPISVKDLFDIRGLPTTAGSRVLADAPPAETDATVIARLRAAGAVIVGRTNMTEFAFSGLGLNPHYGTPANPYDRSSRRIPGGSSSGAAVSVSDGMALAAIGTDTGGSVRIPAALCGLVGFKPTARRIPMTGTLPLSSTLDSIGPIARTVRCCRILDEVMSGESDDDRARAELKGVRFGIATGRALEGVDAHVMRSFEVALGRVAEAGGCITDVAIPEFAEISETASTATFPAAESFSWHRELLDRAKDMYDPRVATRIAKGAAISAANYLWLVAKRNELIRSIRRRTADIDVLVLPTVPLIAPTIAELEADESQYHRVNLLMLRNPTYINFLDGCALSIPCQRPGEAPVGLMLARFDGLDRRLLAIGEAVERTLSEASN
jgi:aspartyl-tRNA(Asn)/glutamyl-tRNA(Gln) amidotransferase subunit A